MIPSATGQPGSRMQRLKGELLVFWGSVLIWATPQQSVAEGEARGFWEPPAPQFVLPVIGTGRVFLYSLLNWHCLQGGNLASCGMPASNYQ